MKSFKLNDLVRVYDKNNGNDNDIIIGRIIDIYPRGLYKIKVKHLYCSFTNFEYSSYPPEWLVHIEIDDYPELFI